MRSLKPSIGFASAAAVLAATPGFALPSQATIADGNSFVSTCAGTTYGSGISPGQVIFGGMSNASQTCGYTVSASVGGTASVTSSASGAGPSPFANSATASAAVGSIHLAAANSGSNSAYFPGAQAVAGWNDQFTLTNGPMGQGGIWVVPLQVSGTLTADGAYPAASGFSLVAFQNHARLSHYDTPTYAAFLASNLAMPYSDENYYQYDQGETWAVERINSDRSVVIDKTVSFAVPFTYGTPFSLGLYAQIFAGEDSYGNSTNANSSGADFSHTIKWGGKGYVVATDGSGPHTTTFAVAALSGFDYSSGVPEPSAWALLVLGVGLAGAIARYRRRLAVALIETGTVAGQLPS